MPSTNSTLSTIPERWAVVVGCEGYTSLPALPGAAADANRVADALRGADYTRVFCLTDVALDASGASKPELFYPTRANLEERLNRFLQPGRLRAEDTLLCYFTGHGLRLADGDYLAPLGLRAGPAEQLTAGDLVSVSGLVKLLMGTGAGQIVLITDACRQTSAKVNVDGKFGEATAASLPDAATARFAYLRSCQTGDESYVEARGASLFTKALCAALGREQPAATVEQVCDYTRRQVLNESGSRDFPQTPALTTNCAEAGAIELWEETGVVIDDDEEDDDDAAEPEPERVEPAAPTPKAATAETVRVAERPPAAETEQRATRRGWIVAAALLLAVGIGVVVTVNERAKPVKDLAAAVAAARPGSVLKLSGTYDKDLAAAVAAAQPGSVLKLSGTYNLAEPLKIDKPLTLEGDGMDKCRVTCAGWPCVVQFTGAGPWTVSGISFEHTGSNTADVVQVENGQFNATRCRMSGAVCAHGLTLAGDSVSNVEDCVCEKNDFHGIFYADNASGTARGNTCRENGYDGIGVYGTSHPTLDSNTCENNGWEGICYYQSSAGTARGNTCRGNKVRQIRIYDRNAHPTLENNVGEVYRDSFPNFRL